MVIVYNGEECEVVPQLMKLAFNPVKDHRYDYRPMLGVIRYPAIANTKIWLDIETRHNPFHFRTLEEACLESCHDIYDAVYGIWYRFALKGHPPDVFPEFHHEFKNPVLIYHESWLTAAWKMFDVKQVWKGVKGTYEGQLPQFV